jgi:hypothetical protein
MSGQFTDKAEDGMIGAPRKGLNYLVPEERLELSRGYPHRILSPARLPFHHSGTKDNINNEAAIGIQGMADPSNPQKPIRRAKDWAQ